jgi:tRNA threonylcarbamoyl adenosine modification protein (Sua5/YciO/YrdC/YwlC family)
MMPGSTLQKARLARPGDRLYVAAATGYIAGMRIYTDIQRPSPRKLRPAIDALRRDEVIIYPTDTGYAFGCALSSAKGAAMIRHLKRVEAGSHKPLSMVVNELGEISEYASMGDRVFRTMRRLLPGSYTLILLANRGIPKTAKNRDHEIGIRMPDHAVCRMLVDLLGEPLLSSSVTLAEDEPDIVHADELEKLHRGDVGLVIDAGPLWPDPSTILRGSGDRLEVLREGQGSVPD